MNITKHFRYYDDSTKCLYLSSFNFTLEEEGLFLTSNHKSIWISNLTNSKYFILYKKQGIK